MGVMVASSLSGCANNEIAQLNSMPSLNSEANTDEGYSMSLGEKQSAIYAQVSERQLLDLSLLSDCSDEEVQAVKTYMNNVDSQLMSASRIIFCQSLRKHLITGNVQKQ